MILPVLCGCETWSLTLGEQHSLRAFKNRVLRRLFGPTREEEEEDCIMRNLVTCTLRQIMLGDEIKGNEMDGACEMHGKVGKCLRKVFVGKPEGKRPLGRRRHRWEDNIRMRLREIRWEDVDCFV
jgi:hypothetical protein